MAVDAVGGADGASAVLDLSPLNGTQVAGVRYGWTTGADNTDGKTGAVGAHAGCCVDTDGDLFKSRPCPTGSCAVFGSSGLPANPFQAKLRGGKCECMAPQVCDE